MANTNLSLFGNAAIIATIELMQQKRYIKCNECKSIKTGNNRHTRLI